LAAKDVLDTQLGAATLELAGALRPALREAGFVEVPWLRRDTPTPADPDPEHWRKLVYTSADPGRPVNLHVRRMGSPGWRNALLFRDWLRADVVARTEYLELKRGLAEQPAADPDTSAYAEAKEFWFETALPKAEAWAQAAGWRMPDDGNAVQSERRSSPKV
jgi:dephospho-CoA kinase